MKRWKAAGEPVDMEKLKITIEEDEVMEDIPDETSTDAEEEDAALEDVKDLYDEDEEGTSKKRKRSATDDDDNEKPKKKVPNPL